MNSTQQTYNMSANYDQSTTGQSIQQPAQSVEQRQLPPITTITTAMKPKQAVAIGDLLISPPEQTPYESFSRMGESSRDMMPPVTVAAVKNFGQDRAQQPPSPPISPWTKSSNQLGATAAVHDLKDPILYPEEPTSPARPLFERRLSPEAQVAVSKHIAAREVAPLPAGVRPPKRQDYELFLCFRETVYNKFFADSPSVRKKWLNREKAQLIQDAKARNKGRTVAPKVSVRPLIRAKPVGARSSDTIVAKTTMEKAALGPRGPGKVLKAPSAPRPVRANPAKAARARASTTPQPEKKRIVKEDKDFNSIPDYSPPLSTLTATNIMRTPAASNAREFDEDDQALLHLLHPDEQQVASHLRLDVATYLTSKRRIFLEKLQFFHQGKPFRKTHAQTACRIDVNKASKLHTAFASVGWLDDKWFENVTPPTSFNI